MDRIRHSLLLGAVALCTGALAVASQGTRSTPPVAEPPGADIVPPPSHLRMSRAAAPMAKSVGSATVEDVGDADSFGRNLRWLGVTNAFATLAPVCDPADPAACRVLAPGPGSTTFDFTDAARIRLPARASHSMLCHWFSPALTVTYRNDTPAPVIARLSIVPSLTIENPVLADPALVDPTTGLPFGGRLQTGMTSAERFEVPLGPGVGFTERTRDSAVCIAGFITRRALVDMYGLTPAQAEAFFRAPMTVKLNVRGSAQHVGFASLIFGLRIVGD